MNTTPSIEFRILVVDDHAASRRYTLSALQGAGCRVEQAAGVREAARRLSENWPDVVLSDWNLEDGNGADVARAVAECQPASAPRPRLVLLTGLDNAMGTGRPDFDAVLCKPCPRAELLQALGLEPRYVVHETDRGAEDFPGIVRTELARRLPELERLLLEGRIAEATSISHRLVASCAFTGNNQLRDAFSALDDALRRDTGAAPDAVRVADCWNRARSAAEDYLEDA